MTSFTFSIKEEGTDNQHILFTPAVGDAVTIPAPGVVFSTDPEIGFRERYALLVQAGVIDDLKPVWAGAQTTQPVNNEP